MKKTAVQNRKIIFALVAFSLTFPAHVFAQSGWTQGLANISKDKTGLSDTPIITLVGNILLWLLGGFGIVGVIGFVIAGILYITAFGDTTKMETAKNAMYYSIIGVIIGLAGLVVIKAASTLLGGATVF